MDEKGHKCVGVTLAFTSDICVVAHSSIGHSLSRI